MLTINKLIPGGRGLAAVLIKRAAQVELDWDVRQKSRFDATDSLGRTLGVFLPRGTAVRVVSQTVGTDELLLALAAPEQVAALSHLARDPAFSAVPGEARRYPQLQVNGDAESILRYAPTLVLFANYSRK